MNIKINEDFELQSFTEKMDKEEWLQLIYNRVNELMAHSPALLFSHLYRLDVDERLVESVLNNPTIENHNLALANLIFERQMKRWETKKDIKQEPIDGWEY